MDIRHENNTEIYVLRACHNGDGTDLLALGGQHSLNVLQLSMTSSKIIASFHIGSRVTAVAWSPRTVSPSSGDAWFIELAVAGADFGLHLLTKSSTSLAENIFPFGGGLSGHHGKINSMSFCGGRDQDSARYVATASDDKMLMVWDLHPNLDISSGLPTPSRSPEIGRPSPSPDRPQPTAYVIPFSHPLTTVDSHPSTSKEFMVTDCRGSTFLTDWRTDPEERDQDGWRHSSVVELVDPRALSDSLTGLTVRWAGSAAWRKDAVDIIGATYGSKFSIWDATRMGGKPSATGISFPEGGHHFRWCQTYHDFFAISTQSPLKGAVIHLHNVRYIGAQPTVFNLAPRPHWVRDFDFLGVRGVPRIAAAVGRKVFVFSVGVEP